ncbi:MAG: hypothetical protein IJ786_01045 [Bacteroidaceae bacterium]|nr:hypothetical protein [Bacteroidaceae bacterium]
MDIDKASMAGNPAAGKHHPAAGEHHPTAGKHHPAAGKHHPAAGMYLFMQDSLCASAVARYQAAGKHY